MKNDDWERLSTQINEATTTTELRRAMYQLFLLVRNHTHEVSVRMSESDIQSGDAGCGTTERPT